MRDLHTGPCCTFVWFTYTFASSEKMVGSQLFFLSPASRSSLHNPVSEERYNAWADQRSWESAELFLLEAFGLVEYTSAQPDEVSVTAVNYTGDDGQELTGFLAMPGDDWIRPLPAVVIFPDWDGNNQYEKERATALAALGYVAFAGDIYGSDKLEVEDFGERIELVTQYSSDPGLYISRMQNAIDQVKALTDDVDSGEISVIGYCFGGSGEQRWNGYWQKSCKISPLLSRKCTPTFACQSFLLFICFCIMPQESSCIRCLVEAMPRCESMGPTVHMNRQ